ncbi:MAG: class I SAM-dependent methyltransferase [Myxococcota bacterium]
MAEKRDDTRNYTAANRRAWNQSAPVHRSSDRFQVLLDGFGEPGFSCLKPTETERLREIGVGGKQVAQLCCNNGRELLSIKNMGAAHCVGFDQSAGFLAQARELAAAGPLECRFVETDIYEISHEFDAAFDLVVITIGVFGWMPDLGGFFDVVSRLLRPGGHLFVHEQHPITNMLEPGNADPFGLAHSYFRTEPFVDGDLIVYEQKDAGEGGTSYWFVHTLGDLISACLDRDLALVHFAESPANISSDVFDVYADQAAQLPLSYTLTARKAAGAASDV